MGTATYNGSFENIIVAWSLSPFSHGRRRRFGVVQGCILAHRIQDIRGGAARMGTQVVRQSRAAQTPKQLFSCLLI